MYRAFPWVFIISLSSLVFRDITAFMMVSTWEDFYAKHLPPQDLAQNEQALKEFTKKHFEAGNKVVLVTVSPRIWNYRYTFFFVQSNSWYCRAEVRRYPWNTIRWDSWTILARVQGGRFQRNTSWSMDMQLFLCTGNCNLSLEKFEFLEILENKQIFF